MKLLRRSLLALLLLAVPLLAWLLPAMLDWNRYRSEIQSLASDTLGRTVHIDGPISLTLLPQPMLTAAKVIVGDGNTQVVKADSLRLRVALGALLAGRVDAQELVLHGVALQLPWPVAPDALILRAPAWLSALSARIEDGSLAIGGLTFTGIDASLDTSGSTGTYSVAGTLRQPGHQTGRDWRFTLRLSRPGGDGSAALDVSLDGLGKIQGVGATLSGQIVADGTMVGHIAARGPDLSQLLPAPPVPFRADGRLNIAGGLAVADELSVELAGSPARGAIALRVLPAPRLDLALTASRLDLDAWLAALLQADAVAPPMPTGIDLSAEAGQLAGATLRGLRGAVDLVDDRITLRELRATLPGDAMLTLNGQATAPDATHPGRFEGDAALAAGQLRPTLAWLQGLGWIKAADPPAQWPDGVLRRADLAGHVTVEPGRIAIDRLHGHLDDTSIEGQLALHANPAARPAFDAVLTLGRLDLAAWWPTPPKTLTSLLPNDTFDLTLKLDAKQLLLGQLELGPLFLDAATEPGRTILRRLDLQIGGARATAAGSLADGMLVDAKLDLQAPQATPLAEFLPDSLRPLALQAPALWRAPTTLHLQAAGAANALALRLTAELGDLRLEAQPMLDLPAGRASSTLTLRHPGAPRLMEALGLPGVASWLGDGSLGLVAQVSLSPGRLSLDGFDLAAGALRGSGTLAFETSPSGGTLTGRVAAETLALPLPYLRSPEPLPLAGPAMLAGWQGSVRLEAGQVLAGLSPVLQDVAATLSLADGVLRVDGLTGKLDGGAVQGTLGLDLRATPPTLAVSARLVGAHLAGALLELPIDLTEAVLNGEASLHAAGYSPAALLATLSGDVSLSARDGVLSGVALADFDLPDGAPPAAVTQALSGGTTAFTRLDLAGTLDGGILHLASSGLSGPAGQIAVAGSIDLSGGAADVVLTLHPTETTATTVPPPAIGLSLNGAFDALHRTPGLADLTRWRAAQATQ